MRRRLVPNRPEITPAAYSKPEKLTTVALRFRRADQGYLISATGTVGYSGLTGP